MQLPNIYAGAYANIAMNRPQAQDTTCCCCVSLDYYLTWSQMRAYGNKTGSGDSHLADWVNYNTVSFKNSIGHGRWNNLECFFSKVSDSSTVGGGNAMFGNNNFNVTYAVDKVKKAGFSMQNVVTIEFLVTVVVALNEYCYKVNGTTADCNYHGGNLRYCVHMKPQVVRTLVAGQASYSQIIYVINGEPSGFGLGTPHYRMINQEDDIACLEMFAGDHDKQYDQDESFSLNINNRPVRDVPSSSWVALKPTYFTNDYCKQRGM